MKFFGTLVEDRMYCISNFGLNNYTGTYRYSHLPLKLMFFMNTNMIEVREYSIPHNTFDFVEFDLIKNKSINYSYLVGKLFFLLNFNPFLVHITEIKHNKLILFYTQMSLVIWLGLEI